MYADINSNVKLLTEREGRTGEYWTEVVTVRTIVGRGEWLGNPANFRGTFYCFGFDVETYHRVTMTLHSLVQSKMADSADFTCD